MNIRINKLIIPLAITLMSLLFAATASAQRSGQSMSVQTGIVIGAQAVNLQSAAGRGAAVGGVVGLAATSSNRSSSRRIRNTAIGAGTGALIARNAQGSLDGMQYTIEVGPGSQIIVVTDQTQVRVGDCVNVEQAGSGTANVRRVSDAMCEAAFANACNIVLSDGVLEGDEKQFITDLTSKLSLDAKTAKTIAQVMVIKNKG